MICFIVDVVRVDIVFSLDEYWEIHFLFTLSLEKVSFDACAIVGVLVRRYFLKDGEKNASYFCWDSVAVCVANKLVTVLTVGYCVPHKN
jgi:hypothetical protein